MSTICVLNGHTYDTDHFYSASNPYAYAAAPPTLGLQQLMIDLATVSAGIAAAAAAGGTFPGAVSMGSTLAVAGIVSISNATASSSATNGALVVAGGAGIGGAANVAGNIILTGSAKSIVFNANNGGAGTVGGVGGRCAVTVAADAQIGASPGNGLIMFADATVGGVCIAAVGSGFVSILFQSGSNYVAAPTADPGSGSSKLYLPADGNLRNRYGASHSINYAILSINVPVFV
jgi:hypothetical protein